MLFLKGAVKKTHKEVSTQVDPFDFRVNNFKYEGAKNFILVAYTGENQTHPA